METLLEERLEKVYLEKTAQPYEGLNLKERAQLNKKLRYTEKAYKN